MSENPFDSIESAHQYIGLLRAQVQDVTDGVLLDIASVSEDDVSRHVEALRVVAYKLNQLQQQLSGTSRTLNDLRALRRLLLGERGSRASSAHEIEESHPC